MTWNYRLVRHKEPNGNTWYQIHEVHYNKAGKIELWTTEGFQPGAETTEELAEMLRNMALMVGSLGLRCNANKILNAEDLP